MNYDLADWFDDSIIMDHVPATRSGRRNVSIGYARPERGFAYEHGLVEYLAAKESIVVLPRVESPMSGVIKPQPHGNTDKMAQQSSTRRIPLGKTVTYGSVILAIVCFESLLFWLAGYPEAGIVNPFAAMLFLVSSPFFFLMGRTIK